MGRVFLGGILCSCLFSQSNPTPGLTSEWKAKGASPLYEKQLESARIQAKAMAPMVAQFEKNVEKLSGALDIFFTLSACLCLAGFIF